MAASMVEGILLAAFRGDSPEVQAMVVLIKARIREGLMVVFIRARSIRSLRVQQCFMVIILPSEGIIRVSITVLVIRVAPSTRARRIILMEGLAIRVVQDMIIMVSGVLTVKAIHMVVAVLKILVMEVAREDCFIQVIRERVTVEIFFMGQFRVVIPMGHKHRKFNNNHQVQSLLGMSSLSNGIHLCRVIFVEVMGVIVLMWVCQSLISRGDRVWALVMVVLFQDMLDKIFFLAVEVLGSGAEDVEAREDVFREAEVVAIKTMVQARTSSHCHLRS